MNVFSKRIIASDNLLFKKVRPVVLDIFCRGVQETKPRQLMLAAVVSIGMTPIRFVSVIFRKAIHIGILLVVWWFLRDSISESGSLHYILLALGILAIFYKDIYDELVNIFLYLVVLATAGGFLRWICKGYISGTGFRQLWLTSDPMERLTGVMATVITNPYRERYEKIMNLYLESNSPGAEELLDVLLDGYRLKIEEQMEEEIEEE